MSWIVGYEARHKSLWWAFTGEGNVINREWIILKCTVNAGVCVAAQTWLHLSFSYYKRKEEEVLLLIEVCVSVCWNAEWNRRIE